MIWLLIYLVPAAFFAGQEWGCGDFWDYGRAKAVLAYAILGIGWPLRIVGTVQRVVLWVRRFSRGSERAV